MLRSDLLPCRPEQVVMMPYLVEDRMPATSSYADFMVALQKAVMSK